mgnify:CR=1 FL=1
MPTPMDGALPENPEQAIYWWNRYLETGSTTFIDPDKVRAKIVELEGT